MLATTFFRLSPFQNLQRHMERVIDSFDSMPADGRSRGFPTLNLFDEGETLWAEAEVPGLSMKDIEVSVVGDQLSIKGQRLAPNIEKAVYHRQERPTGAFERTLTLPYAIDAEAVEATLKDGVLTVKLPKSAAARARRIVVKAV